MTDVPLLAPEHKLELPRRAVCRILISGAHAASMRAALALQHEVPVALEVIHALARQRGLGRPAGALALAIVFDSKAFGTLHAGPIEFASSEENDGSTNSRLFRAEPNAVAVIDREAARCEAWGS